MEERTAQLKLYLDARGRLKKSTLILEDSGVLSALKVKRKHLLKRVGAKIPVSRNGERIYVPLRISDATAAGSWKLDVEEETGLGIRMIDQNDNPIPLSRKLFANPQYF